MHSSVKCPTWMTVMIACQIYELGTIKKISLIFRNFRPEIESMKKIVIIDGGPRRTMNTAQMLRKVAIYGETHSQHNNYPQILWGHLSVAL